MVKSMKVPPDHIVVACSADNNYAMPLAVLLRSLSENLSPAAAATVFVVDGGIRWWNKIRIKRSIGKKNVNVRWLRPSLGVLKDMPVYGHVSICTYFRLLLPELLPTTLRKVIYLDGDTVVTGDLSELWGQKIGNHLVMAVEDSHRDYPDNIAHRAALGLAPESKYFNAGVMVLNLELWRHEKVAARVMDCLKIKRTLLRWWDQDGLNVALEGRWGHLDQRWNCRVDASKTGGDINGRACDAFVVHYASAVKPWHYAGRHPDKEIYFKYLDLTSWSGWRPATPYIRLFRQRFTSTLFNRYWYGAWVSRTPGLSQLWIWLKKIRQELSRQDGH